MTDEVRSDGWFSFSSTAAKHPLPKLSPHLPDLQTRRLFIKTSLVGTILNYSVNVGLENRCSASEASPVEQRDWAKVKPEPLAVIQQNLYNQYQFPSSTTLQDVFPRAWSVKIPKISNKINPLCCLMMPLQLEWHPVEHTLYLHLTQYPTWYRKITAR